MRRQSLSLPNMLSIRSLRLQRRLAYVTGWPRDVGTVLGRGATEGADGGFRDFALRIVTFRFECDVVVRGGGAEALKELESVAGLCRTLMFRWWFQVR